MNTTRAAMALLVMAFAATTAPARDPVPVSPGNEEGFTVVPTRCPTFSWSRASRASTYELLVLRVEETGREDPVLAQSVPGSASSWTPPLDRCFEPGARYGWTVRAVTPDSQSDWAAPALFEVSGIPSPAEVDAAITTLELYLRSTGGQAPELGSLLGESQRRHVETASPIAGSEAAGTGVSADRQTSTEGLGAVPLAVGSPTAALTVRGEIRTLDDSDAPRIWGRGRPGVTDVYGLLFGPCSNGDIRFGLSVVSVDWGSAADACPAGTWVCSADDIVPCNTDRPDSDFADIISCDGTGRDISSNDHPGWTNDRTGDLTQKAIKETGADYNASTCTTLPVWCCWEVSS